MLFAAVDLVGWLFSTALGGVRRRPCRAPAKPAGDPRSILLVQLDHFGDAVLTTAVLPALRRRFPVARIEVLTSEWNRELFIACPQIDRVHVAAVSRFSRGFNSGWIRSTMWWGWRLRRRQFDTAIDIRGEFPLALLLWLSGAKRRLGWDCGGGGFLLTDRARFVPGRPEIESRLALLSLLDVQPDDRLLSGKSWFDPGARARHAMAGQIADVGHPARPLVVVHVGAGTQAKRWPPAHWRELLGRLIVEYGARVVLIGVPGEQARARAITGGLSWPGVADWTGRLGTIETAALIELADLFIGADSGPAHLAAAVGTPCVVLFSGTNNPKQWKPWGARVAVVQHPVVCSPCHRQACPWVEHPCMAGLTPQAVMRTVKTLWRRLAPRRDDGLIAEVPERQRNDCSLA